MKSLTPCLLALVVASLPSFAEFRTLVSNDGKSMKAELVSHAGGKITIRREDGKTFAVDPAIFCKQDQEMIAAWMKENAPDIDYRLKADATKKETSSTDYYGTWEYEISIRNNGQEAVKGITVLHRVVYEAHGRQRLEEGEYVLDQDLEFNRTLIIRTDPVRVWRSKHNRNSGVKGCLVRVLDPKGEVILDWGTDAVGMKGVTWESTNPRDHREEEREKVEIR